MLPSSADRSSCDVFKQTAVCKRLFCFGYADAFVEITDPEFKIRRFLAENVINCPDIAVDAVLDCFRQCGKQRKHRDRNGQRQYRDDKALFLPPCVAGGDAAGDAEHQTRKRVLFDLFYLV